MKVTVPFNLYNGKVVGEFIENNDTGYHAYFVTDEERGLKRKRMSGCTTVIGIKDKSFALVKWATELQRDYLLEKIERNEEIVPEDVFYACELHNEKKTSAANIGTEIHNWCESYIKFKIGEDGYENIPSIPNKNEVKRGINAFLEWEQEHNVRFLSSERVVYSRECEIIGKMDIDAEVDGKIALVDIKTSNGLYNTVKMQTAFYAKADMEENPDKKYETRWVLQLTTESEKEYLERMEKKQYLKEIPEYKIFRAIEFPNVEGDDIETDYEGFKACLTLTNWNNKTDFYKNKTIK